ncbi:PorV/PorQ family protein [bacterium]|nr:PorV/PorQ family protein [bacterium]
MPRRLVKYIESASIRNLFFWAAILTVCTSISPQVYAQGPADGTQSLFIETGMGARAQGFGNAFVATANDGSAVFWNPAGLDYLSQSNLVLFHSTLVAGSFYNFASVTFPFVQFGSVGVGIARVGVDGISITNDFTVISSNQSWTKEEYYFSYGKKLPWFGLALGTTFKVDHTSSANLENDQVNTVSGTGFGLDIGAMWRPDYDNAILRNLSVGLNFQNVVRPSIKMVDLSDTDPYNIKFGLAKDLFFGDETLKKFTLAIDMNKNQETPNPTFNLGAEFTYNRFLVARLGLMAGQMTVGMGTEFNQFQRFQVDYSVNLGNQFGTPLHRLSLTMNFGKTVEEKIQIARAQRLEEDQKLITKNQEAARARALKEHHAQGKELFKDNKLLPALVQFEQVLQLDPANEQAKYYIDSVNMLMDKQLADQLSDTANAIKSLTINEENDKFIRDHYKKGSQLVQKGDYLGAISEYQNALDRSPNNSELAKALNETRGLLDQKIGSYIAKARSSAAANNFAEALKLLSEARGLDPTNQTIQKEIDTELKKISNRLSFLESTRSGLDAYQKADYQAAMEAFEQALLIDPSNETVKEYHKKSIVRGFATFKNLEGDQEKTYLQGVDLYVEGKYEQAIIIWQRILEKDPLNKRVLKAVDKAEEQLRVQKQNNLRKK